MKLVLDVSNVNTISAQELRQSGAVAVIAKATEGGTFKDVTLPGHRAAARRLGTAFGSYVFLHPDSRGSEAGFYLAYARPKPGDIQPAIDAEVFDQGVPALARRVNRCAHALEAQGYDPLLYVSASRWPQLIEAEPSLKRLRVWEAQYPGRYTRWFPGLARRRWALRGAKVVLWQWADSYAVGNRRFDASALLVPLQSILIPKESA